MTQPQMKYRRLGSTGLLVSELSLGTNTFGGKGSPMWDTLGALGQDEANAIVATAFEAGINFIDTADGYAAGESEQIVGEAIRHLGCARDEIVVATKIGSKVADHPNGIGASRGHVIAALDASLRRLKLEHVDVLMMHMFDVATPLEETLRALDDCVRAGKVRYIGCSNYTGWQLVKGTETSARLGLERFALCETHWSAATREVERELVPAARAEGVGLLIWGALLGGVLTGKYAQGGRAAKGRMAGAKATADQAALERTVAVLREVAERNGVLAGQVALAWVLARREVTSVLFGARTPEQVEQNLGAAALQLSPEDLAAIDATAALPHDPYLRPAVNINRIRGPYAH